MLVVKPIDSFLFKDGMKLICDGEQQNLFLDFITGASFYIDISYLDLLELISFCKLISAWKKSNYLPENFKLKLSTINLDVDITDLDSKTEVSFRIKMLNSSFSFLSSQEEIRKLGQYLELVFNSIS